LFVVLRATSLCELLAFYVALPLAGTFELTVRGSVEKKVGAPERSVTLTFDLSKLVGWLRDLAGWLPVWPVGCAKVGAQAA
jgi:hypothetical protein